MSEERPPMKPPETPRRAGRARGAADPSSAPSGPAPAKRSRKPYRRPRLVSYGRLAELTQFGGSQVVDSGNNLGNLQ